MNKTKKNLSLILFIAFFLLGLSLRFFQLGADPLSQNESYLAFQALEGLSSNVRGTIEQSSYFGLTILSFFLTNSSNFVARFWPALIGSLLILMPLLWHKELGQMTTLGLVFVLAIDPVFLQASRMIGSPIFTIFGLIACLSLLHHKKPILSGVSLAIAMLGGESFWLGSIVIILAWVAFKLINKKSNRLENNEGLSLNGESLTKSQITSWILGFVITFLILGSGFTLYLLGLSDTLTGLLMFFQKFYVKSGITFWQPLFAILSYQLLPFVIAIWAGINAWIRKDELGRWLSLWILIALILVTALPGRRLMDIVWIVLPLWLLSVRFVVKSVKWSKAGLWIKVVLAGITLISLIYLTFMVRSYFSPEYSQVGIKTYIIVPLAVLLLLAVSVILVGLGWRFSYSLNGLFIGFLTYFLFVTLSLGISGVVNKSESRAELWSVDKSLPPSSLLVETIESISDQYRGDKFSAEIFVIDIIDKDVHWALRHFENVASYQSFPTGKKPDIVITRVNNLDNLITSYRGEQFLGQQAPAWDKMQFLDYLKWIVDHNVKYNEESLYLWVSTDLFPGG